MMLNQIIGFLLIAITTVTMDSTVDKDQIEFIEDLNEQRRLAANVNKIRNMHELKYSKRLANGAKWLSGIDQKKWEEVEAARENWRYFYLKDYKNWRNDISHFFNITQNSKVDMERKDNTLELLVPLQTEIGCWKETDGQNQEDEESKKHKRDNEDNIFSEYQVFCVIGREGSEESWEQSQNKKTRCFDGYTNNHGLCISNENQSQLTFIEKLNKIRRKFAKKYGISNMHELVFSRKLARMAQYRIQGEATACLYTRCRFTKFDHYENGHEDLDARFERYNSLSDEMKQTEQEAGVKRGYTRPLEHVVPLQTEIGCSEMDIDDPEKYRITCFLGSEGSLDSYFTSKSDGTTCSEGYRMYNGLCVEENEISMKNDKETTEQPEIFIDTNKPEEVSTVPTQDSVTPESANPENPESTTLPPDGNSNGIPPIKPSKVTSAPSVHVPKTTTESELDRLIAKYQREEQDGDLPSDEDEEEYEYSNSRKGSVLVSVIFITMWLMRKY